MLKRLFHVLVLRDRPLKVKLLVFTALFVIVPMVVVGLISYQRSSQLLELQARQYSRQIIEQVTTHVEYYVNDFEISILKLVNNPAMGEFLNLTSREEAEKSGIPGTIKQLLRSAAYSRSDISNITVILDHVMTIDALDDKFKSMHPTDTITDEYWYRTLPVNGEPIIVTRVLHYEDRTEPVLTIARRLISPSTLRPVGTIVLDVNFRRFRDIAQQVNIGRTGFMYIIDAQGHYVYHPDLGQLGRPAQLEHLNGILHGTNGSFVTDKRRPSLLTYSHSNFLDWVLVTSVPFSEVTQGSDYIGRTILITVLVTLVVAYVLGVGLVGSIVRPFRKLHLFMKKVESGDFSGRIEVESRDEIGLLTHGFNKMADHLNMLLEEIYFSKLREATLDLRQREMELKALQMQMNPHFLYNSLETIRGMALEQDMDDIALMTSSLARLLRYNLKNASRTVTLEEELEIADLYLRIQKFRFEDKLQVLADVPPWAREQEIAKFSLQPLIENCIVHGLEPKSGTTSIAIAAYRDTEDTFILSVADTGAGIAPERLSQLRRMLEQSGDISGGGAHIGIANVHQRNRQIFGGGCGLRVESEQGRGTRVLLTLPYRKQTAEEGGPDVFRSVG